MGEPLLMRLGDVKQTLGVGRPQIRRLVELGEIKPVLVGRQTMYERRSVQRWLDKKGVRRQ
jgi:predicted DNA-binding transcriptional regulator AlpA